MEWKGRLHKPLLVKVFSGNLDVDSMIRGLEILYPDAIFEPGSTLILFDEIQDCLQAYSSSEYFIGRNSNRTSVNGEVSRKYIPIGVDDFKEIRDGNYYFVDKSELISDILDNKAKVHLFTRPRRFGKSLNLSMLDAFFNLRYEGNTWFDGLKISGHKETEVHKNAYPVIYLNMKELSVGSYNDFIQDLNLCISRLFQRYEIEGKSCPTSLENMDIYARGRAQKLNESEMR